MVAWCDDTAGHIQAPTQKIKGRVVYEYSISVNTLHIVLNMLNTSLPTGWYTITANTGPVDFCNVNGETRVVVFDGQRFHLERLDNGTYVISSIILGGVVQTTADYRLVFYPGQQRWIVTQYDDQADTYTITEANDPSLAWTDGGGPPGCNHWLYVNEFDPNDIPAAQQFRIVPVSGMRGTIYQRK
ncbi:hypothetical protein V8B97DRAFT_1956752 [Scleroderma yunnanense]